VMEVEDGPLVPNVNRPMFGGGNRLGGPGRVEGRGAGDDFNGRCGSCSKPKAAAYSCSAIFFLALLFTSFQGIEPTKYGLIYNDITKSIDQQNVYQGGLHMIGFYRSFITFPSTACTIEFSQQKGADSGPLTLRTKEGLALTLHVAFQYRIIREQVGALYSMANKYYSPILIQNSRSMLLRAAGEYNATAYWEQRAAIGQEMLKELKEKLLESHVEVIQLQLLIIELPKPFEDSIVATQVQKQQKKTYEMQQKSTQIAAETKVKIAAYERQVKVLVSGGEASKKLLADLATANAAQARIDTEAKASAKVKEILKLNTSQLMLYQRNAALFTNTNSTILWGLTNNQVIMSGV